MEKVDIEKISHSEDDFEVIGQNEEDHTEVIGHNECDTQVMVNNEDGFEVIDYSEEDDIAVIGHKKDDIAVIGHKKDDIDVIGHKKDDIEEINDSEGSDIEVISESEEDTEKMITFYKCQKTAFISMSEQFGNITKAFHSSIPCYNRIFKIEKHTKQSTSSQISDILVSISKRFSDMHKNLSHIDHELQLFDNAVDSGKECISSFQYPAKRVHQMIADFMEDMVEILDEQSDLLKECKRILLSDKSKWYLKN